MDSPVQPYILVSRLGEGGMAEVFKAVKRGPEGFEKPVALKRILPYYADNPEFIRMLSAEARLHAHLDHPNIVQILDFFRHENAYLIALEYVHGKNLRTIVHDAEKDGNVLPWPGAVFILSEVLKALDYAHKKRSDAGPLCIVHRDVSPQNILVSYDGGVKLSDFGIAVANIERDKTRSGVLKGKHRFLAPEQLEAQPVDARTDLFAAGVVLYEALCRRNPFEDENEFRMMKKIAACEFPSSSSLRPDIPAPVHAALDHALKKDPEERPADAQAFRQALLAGQDPAWLSNGTERLAEWLHMVYPTPADRAEIPFERTPVLAGRSLIFSLRGDFSEPGRKVGFSRRLLLAGGLLAAAGLTAWAGFHWRSTESIVPDSEPGAEPTVVLPEPAVPVPEKAVPPAISSGRLKILSAPRGASVFLSGKRIGKIPLTAAQEKIAPGTYLVSVKPRKGKVLSNRVRIEPGKISTLRLSGTGQKP